MLASESHAHARGPIASVPAPPAALHDSHPLATEVAEYEKILHIRDQIFAGTHPRLKIPESVVRRAPPRPVAQTSQSSASASVFTPVSQASASEPAPPALAPAHSLGPAHNAGQTAVISSTVNAVPGRSTDSPGTGASTPKPTSEIDPIFLTKSDDLIRAETQLQRQRLERALRDHAEQKRVEERQKPPLQELKPDFDVSDVLNRALEIVKPLPPIYDQDHYVSVDGDGDRVNGDVAGDSFDENSYYSSRAPDSPQNEEYDDDMAIVPPLAGKMDTEESDETVIVDRAVASEPEHESAAGNHHVLDQLANTDDARRDLENIQPWAEDNEHHYSPPEPYEEPEYSPPGPDMSLNGRRDLLEPSYLSPSSRRQPPVEQPPNQQSPASRNLRVVRNHITSPAAPQPSRVSPLAVTRVSSITQSRQGRQSRQAAKASADQGSAHTSPESAPPQVLMSRKRRRLQAQDRKRLAEEKRGAASPDMPYIKPEPVSPPPFIDAPPPTTAHYSRSRLVQEAPAEVDYAPRHSLPDDHVISSRVPTYDDGHGRHYELDSPIELHTPRTTSRIGYRRPVRDEHDLRRVASLQHARQTEYVHDYPEQVADISPRHGRAVSYAEPIQPERPRYHDESQPAQYTRRYMTRPLSPHYRESYAPVRVSESRVMGPPPPQRRIVVDAEGNRFYESVDAPRPMPPVSVRSSRVESYDGGSHTPARPMSIVNEHYRDRRYIQEMPPPEMTYRRNPGSGVGPALSYAADNELGEPRFYDREAPDRGPMMRSASVQMIDYPPRQPQQHPRQPQPTYVDEAPFPHDEIVRVASVRPPPVGVPRYEEHHEVQPRMTSVRPMRREVSVYVDDEAGHGREYHPPVERYGGGPSYTARPVREERFYEGADPGRMEPDAGPEAIRRVPRRY
ncbi:hypothetical protein MaudCBS49596_006824 [Microsporum audouinii]